MRIGWRQNIQFGFARDQSLANGCVVAQSRVSVPCVRLTAMSLDPERASSAALWQRSSAHDVALGIGLSEEVIRFIGALWGKSAKYGGGRLNLLLSHMLDAAAVAEQMWQNYLAPGIQEMLDQVSGGDGRRFLMWVCGVHDIGKATPAFAAGDEEGQARVRAAGLTWRRDLVERERGRWRHDKAGGRIIRDVLTGVWGSDAVGWVWPLVAGHHGVVPSVSVYSRKDRGKKEELHGQGPRWRLAQKGLLEVFTRCLGYEDLAAVAPVAVPSKADQLCLSGLIVKADWIASDTRDKRFPGLGRLDEVSLANARERARASWVALRLRGGWGRLPVPPPGDLVERRFHDKARPSQQLLVDVARRIPAPGLILVEAPMGEGKTKGMLAAAEVLAARFGADGLFVGMPTQATCDPMFENVRDWVREITPELVDHVSLLHGKRRFNPLWRELWEKGEGTPEDWYGSVGEDEFGMSPESAPQADSGPSEWFLAHKRGLLSPLVVATIDQLLFAATRTKHVMLRFAGLAGKVVVLDEVHAADVYMRQFLVDGLRWLGQARVPVILLSATLPPDQRRTFARAYLEGALGRVGVDLSGLTDPEGYPSVTAVFARDEKPGSLCETASSWRPSQPVRMAWLPDVSGDAGAVPDAVKAEVFEGGVALVVLNTVDRAQSVYRRLAREFPGEVILLHGRLCAQHRADRTSRCLNALGPAAGAARPERLIVVATQLAEQSFDIDADVLITDLAPVDLLLQRIGRLHRHDKTRRPPHLASARCLVTGVAGTVSGRSPELLGPSAGIYGRYLLLRTAALLAHDAPVPREVEAGGRAGAVWSVPEQVPELVAEVYGEGAVCPPEWEAAEQAALQEWRGEEERRAAKALEYVLCRQDQWAKPTLEGLHSAGIRNATEQALRDVVVRDGEMAAEVAIVRRAADGYHALVGGTWLGVHGEACERDEVCDAALGGLTRFPAREALTAAVERELRPLDGWEDVPGLRYTKALVLEEDGFAMVGGCRISYDDEIGLTVEHAPRA